MSQLAPVRRALTFDRSSLRWCLSWLLLITAVLTVTAFGLFAYRAARTTTLDATHTRLRSALSQLNSITELGIVNQLDSLRAVARDPAVIEALRQPGKPISDAAVASLKKLQGASAATATVELHGVDGARLYTTAAASPVPTNSAPPVARPLDFPAEPIIGPMYETGDVLSFDADVTVTAGNARLGGVRLTRRLGRSINRRLTASLLGDQAALLVGNKDGTLWSETGKVAYPTSSGSPHTYTRNNAKWVSAFAEIRGTSWMYAVEMPERAALASARALVTPFVIVGLLIALAGAVAGLRASRKITEPLAALTAATEAIARGERDVKLTAIDRRDEIGRLARSFATMATSVASVRDRLYTTKVQGVGLGLSVSRAFARSNGGDLYVSQTGGVGACFVLDLPAQRADLASRSASAS